MGAAGTTRNGEDRREVVEPTAAGAGAPPDIEPRIIPESEHPIRLADIDREALKVLYRLRDAGFSGYLVGGGVRDLYLGRRPKDFDISTDARPGQLRKLFRNSRTIGRRFRLVQVYFRGNKIIEVSTLRSQSEYDLDDTRSLPANNTFGTLEEDAFRRDLTINSLFYEIVNHTIIDYVGGVDDLNNGIVRIVGNPEVRIIRDPVRMLRAVRHAARTGFTIEEETWRAIVAQRETLSVCPPSRIRDELLKDLVSGYSRPWAEKCEQSRLFYTLFPFYEAMPRKSLAQLFALLGVVDRLHREYGPGDKVLPEYLLFAALLWPWINREVDLDSREPRGQQHRLLLAEIRAALEEMVCPRFNIKRSAKEAMAGLFVNMPLFRKQDPGSASYPKWLRRKSYFQDCVRFAALLAEAEGHGQVPDELIAVKSRQEQTVTLREPRNRGGRGKRRGNPAFSSARGGVFGLR